MIDEQEIGILFAALQTNEDEETADRTQHMIEPWDEDE